MRAIAASYGIAPGCVAPSSTRERARDSLHAMRSGTAIALLTTSCALLCGACGDDAPTSTPSPSGASARRPNVVVISLDTTRADRLGCYGHAAAITPNLDGLATRGTRFERAYAPVPLTLPTHATLWTGLQPPEHG